MLQNWLRRFVRPTSWASQQQSRSKQWPRRLELEALEDRTLLALASFTATTVKGDYVAAGVGLRGQTAGNIAIAGIAAGSTVKSAYLYYAYLDNSEEAAL